MVSLFSEPMKNSLKKKTKIMRKNQRKNKLKYTHRTAFLPEKLIRRDRRGFASLNGFGLKLRERRFFKI